MYFVYILNQEPFYKGQTEDLEKRLREHFSVKVFSTRSKLLLKLVHVEICESGIDARNMEKFFKSGFGREIIKEMINERMW